MRNRLDDLKTYERHNSLRLRGFDYAARRIYSVTVVVLQRRNLFFNSQLAQAILDCLFELRKEKQFNLYCYCLMPDHLHLLIGAGESKKSLGEIVGTFKSLSTRIYWRWHEGKLWQRQFFDHIVRNEQDFFTAVDYIKHNPVRKGLIDNPDEWPYTGEIDGFQ